MSKRLLTLVAALLMLAAFSVTQAQESEPTSGLHTGSTVFVQPPQVPSNQLIMRDGGICDPIRHMGC